MAQATDRVDPQFVEALKSHVHGIYFPEVDRFTRAEIAEQFRRTLADGRLLSDEEYMHNLMFFVRKKEVAEVRSELANLVASRRFPPRVEASALKSLYAIGSPADRETADLLLSRGIQEQLQSADPQDVYLQAAAPAGGPRTLQSLREGREQVAAAQEKLERTVPQDHFRIGQADKLRSAIEAEAFQLSQKLEILARGDAGLAQMVEWYVRRSVPLAYWAYKELTANPSPAAAAAVRSVLARAEELLPPGLEPQERAEDLRDARLRAVCLLDAMRAPLTPAESSYLAAHQALIEERREFFRPEHDWEDVLDRN